MRPPRLCLLGNSRPPPRISPGRLVSRRTRPSRPRALLRTGIVWSGRTQRVPTLAGASISGDGRVATNTGGTQVLFDGVPAPILYTSSGQVAAVVPYAVDSKLGTPVQVRNGSLTSGAVALPVVQVSPSIFPVNLSGTGPAAVLNQDGMTVNSSRSPAAKGSCISIYATGEGQTNPGGIDGRISSGGSLPKPVREVQAWVDGKPAEVPYAGAAPDAVAGLFQVEPPYRCGPTPLGFCCRFENSYDIHSMVRRGGGAGERCRGMGTSAVLGRAEGGQVRGGLPLALSIGCGATL